MKIHIVGASGSGVTTLGLALAHKLNLKYFDTDDYFWLKTEIPFTEKYDKLERNQGILNDLNDAENWILGGSIIQWDIKIDFDLIVFLQVSTEIRIDRLKKRELESYGNIVFANPERLDKFNNFLAWAADYDFENGIANRTLKAHETWLKSVKCSIFRLSGNFSVEKNIEKITKYLDKNY